jgi:uncharacterized protein YbjT (DUF2867 family)
MTKAKKVVVLGGTGMIGSLVVSALTRAGVDLVSASRRTNVNILTGEGLDAALAGADTVIDTSDVSSFDLDTLKTFFRASGEIIHAAEKKAGVRHHIMLSIFGVDQVRGNPYFDAKLMQEDMVRSSSIPYTILRSTQFYEFLPTIASGLAVSNAIRVPNALFSPIAAVDVGTALAELAHHGAINKAVSIAGPEIAQFETWMHRFLAAAEDKRRHAVTDEHATYFGGKLQRDSIAPTLPDITGSLTFENWLHTSAAAALKTDRYAHAAAAMDRHS